MNIGHFQNFQKLLRPIKHDCPISHYHNSHDYKNDPHLSTELPQLSPSSQRWPSGTNRWGTLYLGQDFFWFPYQLKFSQLLEYFSWGFISGVTGLNTCHCLWCPLPPLSPAWSSCQCGPWARYRQRCHQEQTCNSSQQKCSPTPNPEV